MTRALQRSQASLIGLVRALRLDDAIAAREHRESIARIVIADATPRRGARPLRAIDFLQRQDAPLTTPRSRRTVVHTTV